MAKIRLRFIVTDSKHQASSLHLDALGVQAYIVHVKTVSASEARKNWFQLLDEVAAGEVVVVNRKGKRIILKCADPQAERQIPDYSKLIHFPDADNADKWHWDWDENGLRFIDETEP